VRSGQKASRSIAPVRRWWRRPRAPRPAHRWCPAARAPRRGCRRSRRAACWAAVPGNPAPPVRPSRDRAYRRRP
jgi:hypothetical protein